MFFMPSEGFVNAEASSISAELLISTLCKSWFAESAMVVSRGLVWDRSRIFFAKVYNAGGFFIIYSHSIIRIFFFAIYFSLFYDEMKVPSMPEWCFAK